MGQLRFQPSWTTAAAHVREHAKMGSPAAKPRKIQRNFSRRFDGRIQHERTSLCRRRRRPRKRLPSRRWTVHAQTQFSGSLNPSRDVGSTPSVGRPMRPAGGLLLPGTAPRPDLGHVWTGGRQGLTTAGKVQAARPERRKKCKQSASRPNRRCLRPGTPNLEKTPFLQGKTVVVGEGFEPS